MGRRSADHQVGIYFTAYAELRLPQVAAAFTHLGYPLHFVTLGEQGALAEGGYVVLVGVPDPLRARLQRRSH
jgi:hypothetical protein